MLRYEPYKIMLICLFKDRSTLADLRRTRVCFSDFEVLQTIGRGYFGEVHVSFLLFQCPI